MTDLDDSKDHEKNPLEALTSIHGAYTLSDTDVDFKFSEGDQIIIQNFLGTLAEIAVNIVSRTKANEQTGQQDSS